MLSICIDTVVPSLSYSVSEVLADAVDYPGIGAAVEQLAIYLGNHLGAHETG